MLCMCQENKMIHKVVLNRYSSTFEIKIETNNKTFLDGQFKVFNFFIHYNIIGKKTLKLGELYLACNRFLLRWRRHDKRTHTGWNRGHSRSGFRF